MSDLTAATAEMKARGWSPVPIPHGSKAPVQKDWPNRDFTDADFDGAGNVGVILGKRSGGLVDVDLDEPEARDAADALLPQTGLVSGRAGNQRSHRFFVSPGVPSKSYIDTTGAVLVELRGDGKQTVVPPSVHPSGERIEWVQTGAPLHLQPAEMIAAVRMVAIGAIFARHWPTVCGTRHQLALAAGGFLARLGVAAVAIPRIIETAARLAQDPQSVDRGKAAADSAAAHAAGRPVTGAPTLAGLIDTAVVDRVREWFGKPSATPVAVVRRLSDVEPETVAWLWHPYIPIGKVTLIEGDPGLGKSWLSLAIATALSRGKGLPGVPDREPRDVLLLSAEDGLSDTVRPRLDALGADVARVHALDGALTFDDVGCALVDNAIAETKAALVIVDPLVAYLGAKVDIHRANETRAVLARLVRVAEERKVALVAVRHLTKGGRDKAIYRGLGSIDITAASRSVLLVGADSADRNKRALVHVKSNLGPQGEPVGYVLDRGEFRWTGVSDLTAHRILAAEEEPDGSALAEAMDFVREALANGPVPSADFNRQAQQLGIAQATVRRAKDRLAVKSSPRREGQRIRGWLLSLPETPRTLEFGADDGF